MANRIFLPAFLGIGLFAAGCATAVQPGGAVSDSREVKPKVDRVVLAVEPPRRESLEIRHMSTPDGWQLSPMHESLLGIDSESGKKIPRLATSWKVEPDGRSLRFQLRQGVRFHGEWGPFTATDLLHQPLEDMKDDSLAGTTPFWRQAFDRLEIVNDHEVIYHLKRPDGNFLDYVSDQLGGMEVTSKKHFDKNGPATEESGPIAATGPYQWKERRISEYVRYQRAPYEHWRIKPDFPEMEYKFVKEASTRLAALLTGEVQMAALPEDLLQQAERSSMKTVKGRVPALRTFLNFDCCAFNDPKDPSKGYLDPDSPLMDVRVRKALSKAINRDELNKGFFNGKGSQLTNNPLHPVRTGWNPAWEQRFQSEYGFDQTAAKALLVEAGYGPNNPAKITMELVITPGLSSASDISEAVANYWRQSGVNVELRNLETAAQTAERRAGKLTRHTFVQATNSNQWVGIYNMGTGFGRLPGAIGNTGPELAEVDRLLAQISNTLDEQKIEASWKELGEVLFAQHKFIPLFWLPVEIAANPQIVSDWVLPGSISGSFTHTENIKAAR